MADEHVDPAYLRLIERRDHAARDLAEIEGQVRSGELDGEDAARLEETYRREVEQISAELEALEDPNGTPRRSPARMLVGAAVGGAAIVGITIFAAASIVPSERAAVSGQVAAEPADLDEVSNEAMEAVIAANAADPEINGMRLALADRYFAAGDFRSALPHYQAVLEHGPDPLAAGVALARIGWMFYQSGGEAEVAAEYLSESLGLSPNYDEAKLYLSMILLYGLDDASSATPLLEELASRSDLPDEIRTTVMAALADARNAAR